MQVRVVDSHVHFWDRELFKYSWHEPVSTYTRNYGPEEFGVATSGIKLDAIIFVEAAMDLEGTSLRFGLIFQIVAQVCLEKGNGIEATLKELQTLKRVKGVRQVTQGKPPGFMLAADFLAGVKLAHSFGFSVDVCVKYPQLEEVVKMVSLCPPDVRFILDHIGKPDISNKEIVSWKENISKLAAFPNVWCKISGMVTEADQNWNPEDLEPYIKHVVSSFTSSRIMFGSDWPVCLVAATHLNWVQTLHTILSPLLSEQEMENFFSENAKAFYLNH